MNNDRTHNGSDSTASRRVADRDRATKAVELRTRGWSLDQIAEQLDYHDRAAVFRAIRRSLDRVEIENAAQYRALMTDRYESLYRRAVAALDEADEGREVGRAQLLAAARGICDSLVRLLGLDSGALVTVRTETQLDRDIERLTEAVASIDTAGSAQQLPPPAKDEGTRNR